MGPLSFIIPGEPVAWQRAGRGRGGRFYTQAETRAFEGRVRSVAALEALRRRVGFPLQGAVRLLVRAFWSRCHAGPEALLKSTRPDGDNVFKGVADALNKGVLADDGQVAVGGFTKAWVATGEEPRTEVLVAPVLDVRFNPRACPLCGNLLEVARA